MKYLIKLLGRAFKVMKNGVYFIVAAFLVAELLKILIYTKKIICINQSFA